MWSTPPCSESVYSREGSPQHCPERGLLGLPTLGDLRAGRLEELGEDAPLWFALNVIMLWILSVIVFGWAGLIVPALIGVAVVFTAILAITVGR